MSEFKPGDKVRIANSGGAFGGHMGTVLVDDPEYPVAMAGFDVWVDVVMPGWADDGYNVFAFSYDELQPTGGAS